jgi:hypothetical protein
MNELKVARANSRGERQFILSSIGTSANGGLPTAFSRHARQPAVGEIKALGCITTRPRSMDETEAARFWAAAAAVEEHPRNGVPASWANRDSARTYSEEKLGGIIIRGIIIQWPAR